VPIGLYQVPMRPNVINPGDNAMELIERLLATLEVCNISSCLNLSDWHPTFLSEKCGVCHKSDIL